MTSVVTVDSKYDIALIRITNPPVNALSQPVRSAIQSAVKDAVSDPSIAGVIISGGGKLFIGGADIREFGQPVKAPSLPDLIAEIEQSEIPVVAAIHGVALGGGLELSLGCHYRVAAVNARLGLPEVTLGLIPGAGGTQRLPRLIGIEKATGMITGGRQVPAEEAMAMGLIDTLVTGELEAGAIEFLRQRLSVKPRRLGGRPSPKPVSTDFFAAERKRLSARSKGQISPLKALELVEVASHTGFEQGMKIERETFIELRDSDQSKALRQVFFAERAVSKVAALEQARPQDLDSVAVIGGGTMGSGIATSLMMAGYTVALVELDQKTMDKATDSISANLQGFVKRRRLAADRKAELLNNLLTFNRLEPIRDCDLVIEAVYEDMAVKLSVFKELDRIMQPDAIVATNTSYLDINQLGTVLRRPQNFVGLHFFSPAQLMKLVEIVKAQQTSAEVLATCIALVKKMGKIGVIAGAGDGFIGNRLLSHWRKQADYLIEDGALPWQVDAAMEAFGMAMGPFKVMDLAGLDISWAMRTARAVNRDPRERYVRIADRLCQRGWFGRKTGKGWYLYEDNQVRPNPEVEPIILAESAARGIDRKPISADEIQQRILVAMINEAGNVLAEGIAQRPLEIDLVKIHGYGFPRWRGGPLCYADSLGPEIVLGMINNYAVDDPYYWQPSPLLQQLVAEKKFFRDLNL